MGGDKYYKRGCYLNPKERGLLNPKRRGAIQRRHLKESDITEAGF